MSAPAQAPPAPARWRIVAAFAAVYVIWGSTYLAIRIAIDTLPPFLMAGMRFLLAGSLLAGWARARGAAPPARGHWLSAAMLGALFLVGGNGGVVWAEQRVPTGLTSLLVACTPVWTVLVDWLRPGGARPGGRTVVGLAVGFAGVALLVAPGRLGGAPVDPAGAVVLLLASLSWSVGSVYTRQLPQPASPLLATGMQMLCGGVALAAGGMLAGEATRLTAGAFTPRAIAAVLYLVVFGSLIGFTAFTFLLRHASPARVATYAYVNPVVAVGLGWALAGETLSPRAFAAAAVILSAVVLIQRSRDPAPVRR